MAGDDRLIELAVECTKGEFYVVGEQHGIGLDAG